MTVKLPSSFSRPLPFPLLFILIVPQGFLFLGGGEIYQLLPSFIVEVFIFVLFFFFSSPSLPIPVYIFHLLLLKVNVGFQHSFQQPYQFIFISSIRDVISSFLSDYFLTSLQIPFLRFFSSSSFSPASLFFYFTSSFLLVLYALPTPTFCQGHDQAKVYKRSKYFVCP